MIMMKYTTKPTDAQMSFVLAYPLSPPSLIQRRSLRQDAKRKNGGLLVAVAVTHKVIKNGVDTTVVMSWECQPPLGYWIDFFVLSVL